MVEDSHDHALLLPHSGVARLLTAVSSCRDGIIEAHGTIPAGHPLCVDGKAPTYLGVELGAQAAAAMEALDRVDASGMASPRVGHLVRVRDAALFASHLPVDTPLLVTAILRGSAPPVAIYDIEVSASGHALMRAEISTHSGTVNESETGS